MRPERVLDAKASLRTGAGYRFLTGGRDRRGSPEVREPKGCLSKRKEELRSCHRSCQYNEYVCGTGETAERRAVARRLHASGVWRGVVAQVEREVDGTVYGPCILNASTTPAVCVAVLVAHTGVWNACGMPLCG